MKAALLKYILFVVSLIAGAFGLAESELFSLGEALIRAFTIFIIVNLFLVAGWVFRRIKIALYKQEMKNPKYRELESEE